LLSELFDAGFVAMIVAVREDRLPTTLLGRLLDWEAVAEIESHGADACGEEGEYHTLVIDGPLFEKRLQVLGGEQSSHSGVRYLDIVLAKN